MDEWMTEKRNEWINELMNEWINEWMEGGNTQNNQYVCSEDQ